MFNITYAPPKGPPPHRVRIEAIADAWNMVLSDPTPRAAGIAVMLGSVLLLEAVLLGTVAVFVPSFFSDKGPEAAQIIPAVPIVFAVIFLVNIPMLLIQTSMHRMGLLKLRGQPIEAGDVFKLDGAAWAIVQWAFMMMGAVTGVMLLVVGLIEGFIALFHPGPDAAAIAGIFGILGYFALVLGMFVVQSVVAFVPLVILDQRLSPMAALKLSWRTFFRHTVMVCVVLLIGQIVGQIGVYACFVGMFLTGGISFAVVPIMYNDFFRPMPLQPQTETPGSFDL